MTSWCALGLHLSLVANLTRSARRCEVAGVLELSESFSAPPRIDRPNSLSSRRSRAPSYKVIVLRSVHPLCTPVNGISHDQLRRAKGAYLQALNPWSAPRVQPMYRREKKRVALKGDNARAT
jgi:hypothetical protein